ncbi:MAG TPA: FlgD immunoglobulin-like domain containing protein [Spirochaetia bacterium]|nr:FlgD immunoglobulin-like domain containing protein [Spirochaetia bacterium]
MTRSQKLFSFVVVFVCISTLSVFAAGNKEAPQISVQTSGPQYLSPNGDGVKDTADLSFSVTLRVKSDKGFVPQYGLTIEDSSGSLVRTITETEKSDINWFVKIFTGYKDFTLKKTVTWDGKNDSGQVVPDGTYKAKLFVVDANGNKQSADLSNFIVDTKAPTVSISAPNGLLFSPNGDGNMDTLQIDQTDGTEEALWTGTFTDSGGTVVRTMKWENGAPKSFAWDGMDDNGKVVPDGTYSYTLSSTDLAGNKSKDYQITGILVNTTKTPITVALTEPYISPNGDGVKDTTSIELSADTTEPISSWSLSLENSGGSTVRQIEGKGQFPSSVPFDGKGANGTVLSNGSYMVVLKASFQNGNVESSKTPLVINTTPPKLAIGISNPYFSPNGDGVKDTTTGTFAATTDQPIDVWKLAMLSSAGKVLAQEQGAGDPPRSLTWDGKDLSGKTAPEGEYTVKYTVTLKDGTSATATAPVTIDLTPPKVEVTASTPIFTPNSTDSKNTEIISFAANEPVTWQGSLADAQGQQIMTTAGPMSLDKVTLDKSLPQVASAPDGVYNLALTFTDRAGNTAKATPVNITLISKPISTTISTASAFSPNNDGTDDVLAATIDTTSNAGISKWDIGVIDTTGKLVADYPGTGSLPSDFRWNGVVGQKNGSNVIAPDGTYTLRLTVNYANGITGQAASNSFLVDTKGPAIGANASPDGFIVTPKGLEGSVAAKIDVKDADPISSWSIDILNPDGSLLKSYAGQGNPTQSLTWKGTLPLPGKAPTEISSYPYGVKMTATDSVGNVSTVTAKVDVMAIGTQRADGKIQMLVPDILFGPYEYALDSRSAQQGTENMQALHTVATVLQKDTAYNLEVDGYSMEIYKKGTPEYTREESIIVPLSKNRADTVRDSLVNMGLSADRIIAKFFGGLNPLVDPLNENLRWQNRRVEFILMPK